MASSLRLRTVSVIQVGRFPLNEAVRVFLLGRGGLAFISVENPGSFDALIPCHFSRSFCSYRALLFSALRRMKEAEKEVFSTAPASPALIPLDHSRRPGISPPLPPSQVASGGHGDWGEGVRSGKGAVGDAAADSSGTNDTRHVPPFRDSDVVSVGANGRPPPPPLVAMNGGADVVAGGSSSSSSNGTSRAFGGIEMEDLEAALKGFSAESLRGAGLFRSSVEWGDVGGLSGVRAELREILEVRHACERVGRDIGRYTGSFDCVFWASLSFARGAIFYPRTPTLGNWVQDTWLWRVHCARSCRGDNQCGFRDRNLCTHDAGCVRCFPIRSNASRALVSPPHRPNPRWKPNRL